MATLLLVLTGHAAATPITLACNFASDNYNINNNINQNNNVRSVGKRQWVYDVQAQTVDGHRVGETVEIKDGAYNRYFITDTAIGFSTSTGVRHTVSRVDGSYKAFDANGKRNGAGLCTPNH